MSIINPDVSLFNMSFKGRSAYAKLSEVVSVKDFPAKGDATWNGSAWVGTDDTAAFQAMLTSGRANGIRDFRLPAGSYITDTLELLSGERLIGTGWPNFDASVYTEGTGGTRLISKSGFDAIRIGPITPWSGAVAVRRGEHRYNSGNEYICTTGGTTAGSGGPTTAGTGIADNTAVWDFVRTTTTGANTFTSGVRIESLAIEGSLGCSALAPGVGNGIASYQVLAGGNGWLAIHDVLIRGMGGRGIYLPRAWHLSITDTTVDYVGDNLFEWDGNPTTRLERTYARRVPGVGKAGYRAYGGQSTLIAANGIDNTTTGQSFWGIFGRSTGAATLGMTAGTATTTTDDTDVRFEGTLIGCNVEAFKDTGILYRRGAGNLFSSNFIGSPGVSVRALYYENDASGGYLIDGSTTFDTAVTTYLHTVPIHANNNKPALFLGRSQTQFWLDVGATLTGMPVLSNDSVGAWASLFRANALTVGNSSNATIFNHDSKTLAIPLPNLANGATGAYTVTGYTGLLAGAATCVAQVAEGTTGSPTFVTAGVAVTSAQVLSATTVRVTVLNNSGALWNPANAFVRADTWGH